MSYFNRFQLIGYDIEGKEDQLNVKPITNILQRVRMKMDFIKNRVLYVDFSITDGDTPESISYDYYGTSGLHWIVLFAQQITNPYYEWPLTYYDLNRYVDKKYGSTKLDPHHYEDTDGNIVNEPGTPIGNGTTDVYGNATTISNMKYEELENDKRRLINLIKPEYTGGIEKELSNLLSKP